MPQDIRLIHGGIFLLLFGWMTWTFVSGPEFEYKEDSYGASAFTVRCEPMLWGWGISWSGTPSAREIGDRDRPGYDIVDGELPASGSETDPPTSVNQARQAEERRSILDDLERFCDHGRTGQAGMIGLAAVPASMFGMSAIIGRRRRPE
ncbi:hypothetical protein [Actinomadura sp. 9N407]|uniref:hypothetical protein n=1 Tax=Actinomadura sp. 9N407 TaxID=3375154 RepID=UPI0037992E7C